MSDPLQLAALPADVARGIEPRRVLDVELASLERDGGAREARPWRPADDALAWIASWGGSALAAALLAEGTRDGQARFVVSVGEGVLRGVPTAARATLSARAPLTGRLGEGQVGGELGARLAHVADALVLRGRTSLVGAVLVVDAHGRARLESRPELAFADVLETRRRLRLPPGDAHLCVGPAAERGVAFASLASGGQRPSFVGRGGLGAAFARHGLKALVLEAGASGDRAPRAPASAGEHAGLLSALVASPRLAARASGGSLELFALQAARGDGLGAEQAQALLAEVSARARQREGCRGCPTPCGWTFERSGGALQRGRFNASEALGAQLGLQGLDTPLRLLAACDRVGVDAKETGALLALSIAARERGALAGPSLRADVQRLEALVLALAEPESGRGDGWPSAARDGARAFAAHLGLEEHAHLSRGEAARDVANQAALLGQFVSLGGADPMRSFPFLLEDAGRAGLERLCPELAPLPADAHDPRSPSGKGRIVYWHENLVSAVDASGFCTFSTAGLLADGRCDVDQLAEWILPGPLRDVTASAWGELAPGQRLLAAGANLVLLRRELERAWGVTQDEPESWARARLAAPGMLDEYRAYRGLAQDGRVEARRLHALGTPGVLAAAAVQRGRPTSRSAASRAPRRRPGSVELRSVGPLAQLLGSPRSLALALPVPLFELCAELARGEPALERQLIDGERIVPSVWRAGARLEPDSLVDDGDVLDLVTAISGG